MGRLVRRHPFTLIGLVGLFAFGLLILLPLEVDSVGWLAVLIVFRTLGFGFHLSANLLSVYFPDLPGLIDVTLVIALGFAPYLAADFTFRRLDGALKARRLSLRSGSTPR